ncbi:hypothetical protein JCM5296_001462 [Sporobolomyces johnsonii]
MSRRRSASLSRSSIFRDDAGSPSFDLSAPGGRDNLAALGLAGDDDAPRPSRGRSLERSAGGLALTVSLKEACVVQVLSTRPSVLVRKSPRASTLAVPRPAGRPTPKRAMTRMIPTVSSNKDEDKPFDKPDFQRGLRWAGYLEPLDTSRKKIKQRFVHGLEKEDFTAHLDAFLEQKGIKKRGEWMIRFVGATDPHSPYVHLFTTSLLTDTASLKVYAADLGTTSSKDPDAFTQWTNLPSSSTGESEWACKAKQFWPLRCVLEGPKETDSVPVGTAAPVEPTAAPIEDDQRRSRGSGRTRRDTFQDEIDLDVELEKRAALERAELETNTQRNALRPSESASVRVNPKETLLSVETTTTSSSRRRGGGEQDDAPATPTILESVRQLGQSVVSTLQPTMQQLPGAVQSRLGELRGWFQPLPAQAELYDEEEEQARKERRRARRRERRKREKEEARELERMVEMDMEAEKEERRARKEERRRRRAERELAGQ